MYASRMRLMGFTALCVSLGTLAISCHVCAIAADTSAKPSPDAPKTPPNPVIGKAFISFRIGTAQWMPDHRYRELLALFEKYTGVTDEITCWQGGASPKQISINQCALQFNRSSASCRL